MKTTSYLTLIYCVLVFLNGLMAFQSTGQISGIFFEVPLAIVLFIDFILMVERKKYTHHLAVILTILLGIYYCYFFATQTLYFAGVLAAFSALVFAMNLIQVFHLGEPE